MIKRFLKRLSSTEKDSEDEDQNLSQLDKSPQELLDEAAEVLRKLGYASEEVRESLENLHEEEIESGRSISDYLLNNSIIGDEDLEKLDRDLVWDAVMHVLFRPPKSVHHDWKYNQGTASWKIDRVLNPRGLGIKFEDNEGEEVDYLESYDEEFTMKLVEDGKTVKKTQFQYPDTELQSINIAELVKAINSRLLDEKPFSFYQINTRGDDWCFELIEDERFEKVNGDLQEVFGYKFLLPEPSDTVI